MNGGRAVLPTGRPSHGGGIERAQVLLRPHLQQPTLLHDAHILAALGQVDVRVYESFLDWTALFRMAA